MAHSGSPDEAAGQKRHRTVRRGRLFVAERTGIRAGRILHGLVTVRPGVSLLLGGHESEVLPSIANLSLAIGLVASGALLVELVFNYPGVGDLLLNAIQSQDYPLIQGIFLCITLTVLAATLLADLVYLWLDPRTRTEVAP